MTETWDTPDQEMFVTWAEAYRAALAEFGRPVDTCEPAEVATATGAANVEVGV